MTPMQDGRMLPRWINIYVAVTAAIVLLPIVVIVPVSFSANASLSLPTEGLSLRWYQSVFGDASLIRAFLLSILIATVSSLISLLAGIPAAYVIARRNLRFLDAILLTPITFPAVVFGGALLMVLSPIGLVRTIPGLIAAHVLMTLPFVIRTMVATVHGIDTALEDAATILGAGRLRVLACSSMTPHSSPSRAMSSPARSANRRRSRRISRQIPRCCLPSRWGRCFAPTSSSARRNSASTRTWPISSSRAERAGI
jgi:ABC-type spermidine/putrescine transport system permease subunit II